MTPKKQEKIFPLLYSVELLRIAQGDLQSAEILASGNPDRKENIIYLAQQSLEKALKAVLCALGLAVPLIHDIGALIAKIPSDITPPFGYELARLTEYAAIRQYIEGPEALETDEIQATLLAVSQAVAWCASLVQEKTP